LLAEAIIDLNTANLKAMAALPGSGKALANAIMEGTPWKRITT